MLPGYLWYEDPCLQVQDAHAARHTGHGHHGVAHALARVNTRGVRRAGTGQLRQLPRERSQADV